VIRHRPQSFVGMFARDLFTILALMIVISSVWRMLP
jgi:hypothetical protein